VRVETPGPLVHAALVTEGVNLTSDHLPAIYVLQQALGGTAFVQNGLNSSSKLYKAASSVTGQAFAVSTVSLALVLYGRVTYSVCESTCVVIVTYNAFLTSY